MITRKENGEKIYQNDGERIEHDKKKLYYLNWVIMLLIMLLLLFFPIISISGDDKDSLIYRIGNLIEYYEEDYTLYGVTNMFADKFVDAEEWMEIKELIGGDKYMKIFITRDVVITVVLFFVISYFFIYILILLEYIWSLIDVYKGKRKTIIYGKGFCVATIILCIMSIIMLLIINGYFNVFIIQYTVSPYLLLVLFAALFNWKVIIPEYNNICNKERSQIK